MAAGEPTLLHRTRLTPTEVDDARALIDVVTATDSVGPLSEHVLLHLPDGGDEGVVHTLVRDAAGALVGYAHLDRSDAVSGASAELAVHPLARRRGVAARMVARLVQDSPGGRLRLWAHGEHPGAAALAARMGFTRSRVLWQMRRGLTGPLPEPLMPAGVRIRTFQVGVDEPAWTALNSRAFADLPDQGDWGVEEVLLREKEPWFDPEGFFLAERDGRLVGAHWTKVHGAQGPEHSHPPVGEVYIVGVDPAEQGHGLGPALTLVGLRHLKRVGLASAMLYVDESNSSAIRVYERLGFQRFATDVCYSRQTTVA
ncbi:MAG: mycothiol synthase [Actinomycetota bacterium]|nr:mycothiol synthase [Actinomycetota bacterium]